MIERELHRQTERRTQHVERATTPASPLPRAECARQREQIGEGPPARGRRQPGRAGELAAHRAAAGPRPSRIARAAAPVRSTRPAL